MNRQEPKTAGVPMILGLTSRNTHPQKVELFWDPSPEVDGYVVLKYDSASKNWEPIASLPERALDSFQVNGLTAGRRYSYSVRGYKIIDGQRKVSENYLTHSVTPGLLPPFNVCAVVDDRQSAVKLTWNLVEGATAFDVHRSQDGGEYARAGSTDANNPIFLDRNVKKGSVYRYTIVSRQSRPGTEEELLSPASMETVIVLGESAEGLCNVQPEDVVMQAEKVIRLTENCPIHLFLVKSIKTERPVSEQIWWLSEDPSIASFDGCTNQVTGRRAGKTTGYVRTHAGVLYAFDIEVTAPVLRLPFYSLEYVENTFTGVPYEIDTIHRYARPSSQNLTSRYQPEQGFYRSQGTGKPGSCRISFVGDIMCGGQQQLAGRTEDGYSFHKTFEHVRPILTGSDFAIGNLETVITETVRYTHEARYVAGRPNCNSPVEFLDALKYAGFDGLITANNHMLDGFFKGLFDTICRLEAYRFLHTGSYLWEDEERFLLTEINGIRVAFMGYTTILNQRGKHLNKVGRNMLLGAFTKERAQADVAAARDAGAEFLIGYLHWGKEYQVELSENQSQYRDEMLEAGFDYIVGSHAHILQPFELAAAPDGRTVPIAYGLGNFTSMMDFDAGKDTIILNITLQRDADGHVGIADQHYIPCHLLQEYRGAPYVLVPTSHQTGEAAIDQVLSEAEARITEVIGNHIRKG